MTATLTLEIPDGTSWADVPEPFQADLATLDQLDNEALWSIAYSKKADDNTQQLESDRFMLRKAQAAAILRWRGCHVPLP